MLSADGNLACCLRRVRHKEDAAHADDVGDLLDRLDHARLVVRPHHADKNGLVGQRGFDVGGADEAVFVHWQVGDAAALPFEGAAGVERGLVLGLYRNDVTALPARYASATPLSARLIDSVAPAGEK